MATFAQILEALAASLEPIDGLQQSAYVLGSPTFPAADVIPGEGEYDKTMQRGLDQMFFRVRVVVGMSTDEGAQRLLAPFLDPAGDKSIKQAIEADDTLGGLAHSLRVTGFSGYTEYPRGGVTALGCEWRVEVWPTTS